MVAQHAPRKKLIEVSIPLEAINKESVREKSIRHGHPSTLHLWWSRKPLATCRGVIFAQIVDDPCSCAEEFPTKAEQDAERERLHRLIEKLVAWEASNDEAILNEARYEIARSVARGRGEKLPPSGQIKAKEIIHYLQEHAPAVCDPFSGGGSIALEAQRLGLRSISSDINPVAVLIGKALVEFPPRFSGRKPVNPETNELHQWRGAQGLAEDVRYYGRWVRDQAQKKISYLYPKVKLKDGKEATVIAWLWARTVPSPDPRVRGGHVPLASSLVLSAKAGKEVIVKPVVDRAKMNWHFEVESNPTMADLEAAKEGTKAGRATFACLLTGTPIGGEYIDTEAQAGRMSETLVAIIAESKKGKAFFAPTPDHAAAAQAATKVIAKHGGEMDLPSQECRGTFASNAQGRRYKFKTFSDYFTARQLLALTTFSDLVQQAREKVLDDATKHWSGADAADTRRLADGGRGPPAYADAVTTYLACCLSRAADFWNSNATWEPEGGFIAHLYTRQGIPIIWSFAEASPLGEGTGSWVDTCVEWVARVLQDLRSPISGTVTIKDATSSHFPPGSIFSTDPPYYDNVGYADLADFFYVWLRRTLRSIYPEEFRRILTPKAEELFATPYRHGSYENAQAFFMDGMRRALSTISTAGSWGPISIYYAFKQSEASADGVTSAGWASFLQAVVESGLAVDGTWPMRSERGARTNAKKANALASSIVLVCRRRDTTAPSITRADFLRVLRREMPAALVDIRRAGVGPTDIQQAAIGPGIGIFTRYAHVLNTDGTPMLVKDALKLINQVREEIASTSDADYDSETRFALDWFAAKGFEKGRSGDAIVMTNAVDISLDGMNAAGFFLADSGVARLLKREELPDDWDPANGDRATVWEACQHLIKRLRAEDGGIDAAAKLYNRLGSRAEPAHALARRLYDICEQNQWAAEGYVYNQLHQEWNTIEKRAAALAAVGQEQDLFSR
jgi:putative DNA methylase